MSERDEIRLVAMRINTTDHHRPMVPAHEEAGAAWEHGVTSKEIDALLAGVEAMACAHADPQAFSAPTPEQLAALDTLIPKLSSTFEVETMTERETRDSNRVEGVEKRGTSAMRGDADLVGEIASLRALLDEANKQITQLKRFAFGGAPEWERANATLKHEARELQEQITRLEQERDRVSEYTFIPAPERYHDAITVQRRYWEGSGGPYPHPSGEWSVKRGASCLNEWGEWELEPQPSSRDEAFYSRCRFYLEDALNLARSISDSLLSPPAPTDSP